MHGATVTAPPPYTGYLAIVLRYGKTVVIHDGFPEGPAFSAFITGAGVVPVNPGELSPDIIAKVLHFCVAPQALYAAHALKHHIGTAL